MSHVAKIEMQNRLFAELSNMFGREVPLYDKSLVVNRLTNRAVCDLLSRLYRGFEITDEMLERTSGERHGAIRIGRPDEYRLIGRFFAAFGMEPHNFYDMSSVGAKSQPIVATAFRSRNDPEHRVFTSLLRSDYFDVATRRRIESRLSRRQVFSQRAKALIEKSERDGGLERDDADALIREGTERIFKWTGTARDHGLYTDLCTNGLKIVADIVCFDSHHLNHLTPNTLCMDLFTSAMKFCMREIDEPVFRKRAAHALTGRSFADRHWMRLAFRHLTPEAIDAFVARTVPVEVVDALVDWLVRRLTSPECDFSTLDHSGFKDSTEGPGGDTPILLRQDAYKALVEPVMFRNDDGSTIHATHTARFGEVEQRFYATTSAGRRLYDRCLAHAEADLARDPALVKNDFEAYEARYASHFAAFPKTFSELRARGLIHARYTPTAKGREAQGREMPTDIEELVRRGYVRAEGLRYEDFLPVSAAGIFASNLNQYGTQPSAAERPSYTKAMLEEILGRSIIDTDEAYERVSRDSARATLAELGASLREPLPA